ncbi:MAG TPA: pyridoxal 5'-phosphate synthase glutaminase subunit PdxT, partial [Arthrobacter sp.]|nr:pyridoxal 5'-phosphate synthase glutaminase subunit PdxT [Arthrobacter sp.]
MTNPSSAPPSGVGSGLRIGVLALQGDFREHL